MTSKIMLSALAAVAAIAIVGAAQDPTFDYPAAKHVGFDIPKEDQSLTSNQSTEKVSVTFRNASIREVLDWLKNQGVSFVVGDDQVNKDGHVNINVMNQSLDTVMRALGTAWDGHWEKRDGMYVFRKGASPFGLAPSVAGQGTVQSLLGRAEKADEAVRTGAFGGRNLLGTGGLGGNAFSAQGMPKEQQELLQKALKDRNNPKAWEEFQKSWEKWAKDYEKNFQEFEKNFKGKDFKFQFDEKQLKELEKQSEDMAKTGEKMRTAFGRDGKGFIYDGKAVTPFDKKQLEEMQKNALDMAKVAEKMRLDSSGAKGFTFDGSKIKTFDPKQLMDLEKGAMDMARSGNGVKRIQNDDGSTTYIITGPKTSPSRNTKRTATARAQSGRTVMPRMNQSSGVNTSAHNLKAIYDSLTPIQEQKLDRLGYINYSDLNSNQRALLGVITDESWTITYKSGDAKLTIKSNH